jgi:hypothetical protein
MLAMTNLLFRAAFVHLAIGIALGVYMSLSFDFRLRPVHVHVNLLGWVCLFLFAAFYMLFPAAQASRLARLQAWLAIAAVPPMMVGLALVVLGHEMPGVPLLLLGEALFVGAAALFVVIGFRATAVVPARRLSALPA